MVSSSPSQSSLSSAELVADRIGQARFFEARFLFNKFCTEIDSDLRVQLQKQIDRSFKLFQEAFARAEQLECAGRLDEAAASYEQVAAMVIDHPHLSRARQRLENYRQLGLSNKKNKLSESEEVVSEEKIVTSEGVASSEVPPVELFAKPAGHKLVLIGLGMVLILSLSFGTFFYLFSRGETVDRGVLVPVLEVHGGDKLLKSSDDTGSVLMEVVKRNSADSHDNTVVDNNIWPNISPALPVPKVILETGHGREEQTGADNLVIIPFSGNNTLAAVDIPEGSQVEIRNEKDGELKLPLDYQPADHSEVIEDVENIDSSLEEMEFSRQVSEKIGETGKVKEAGKEESKQLYVVISGDTLEKISAEVYGDRHKWSRLLDANREKLGEPPFVLRPGMELVVPPPGSRDDTVVLNEDGTYTVQSGDTLGSIAVKVHGSSLKWQEIYELNRDRLSSPTSLQVGQRLLIKKAGIDSQYRVKNDK